MPQHTVILIVGPTAVGKTAVTIKLAQQYHTEIISADSRQCYREMCIGVARPSVDELASVKHHFIASHSIHENVNAGVFEAYALGKASELFNDYSVLLMTGGTGLYVKAFCEGIDEMPQIDLAIREAINIDYEKKGLEWLQEEVKQKDPNFWGIAEQQNPQRLMRALAFLYGTGQSITTFRVGKEVERPFRILKIGLEMPRADLNQRINLRVDAMMQAGLLDEVQSLFPHKHLNALQTVGYQEIFDYLDGQISFDKAVELIKQHTRQYAKRQMTWFKKDSSIHWVNAAENIDDQLNAILSQYF